MFDVGFSELVLLAFVGLLVLGPERLPRVARTLGGLARKARSSWLNLKRSIEDEINADELKEPLKKIQQDIKTTVDQMGAGVESVKKDFSAKVSSNPEVSSNSEVSPNPKDSSKHDE